MPLVAWRITATRDPGVAFDGEGARLYGGRWNRPGTRLVYAAEHLSLAALELFVHLDPEDQPRVLFRFRVDPAHPRFRELEIEAGEPFSFDSRIRTKGAARSAR